MQFAIYSNPQGMERKPQPGLEPSMVQFILAVAAPLGSCEVEELLLHGALLRQPNAEGLQAVHLAVRNGRLPPDRRIC